MYIIQIRGVHQSTKIISYRAISSLDTVGTGKNSLVSGRTCLIQGLNCIQSVLGKKVSCFLAYLNSNEAVREDYKMHRKLEMFTEYRLLSHNKYQT